MSSSMFLRRVLALDAFSCLAMGLGMSLGASPLAPLLGLPVDLVRGAGIVLLPIGAFIAWLSARPNPSRLLVWLVILGNIGWTLESFLVLRQYGEGATAVGTASVSAQALAVLALAILEYAGLRRAVPAAA